MNFDILPFLERYFEPDEKIILACSTWADSMFLLYKILKTPYKNNLVACYFNHGTRPECAIEENFLLTLWESEGFQVEIGECDFEKIQKLYPSKSFEELAREKRYQFLDAVCHIYGANKVLTAHHLDDRIETFFFHMLRGSKLSGLINMQEASWGILRPLLSLEKADILEYLKENNLKYFEDSSNQDSKYTRNYLRNQVLPKLSQVHPEHKKNLENLIWYFWDLKSHIDSEVEQFLWAQKSFYLEDFLALSPFLQKEIIRHIYYISNNHSTIGLSQANITEVLKFLTGKNNKTHKEIRNMKLFKDGKKIYF